MKRRIKIGIPGLRYFDPKRGIGRFAAILVDIWRKQGINIEPLEFTNFKIPLLRNIKTGILKTRAFDEVDVLFFPNFLGCEVLIHSNIKKPAVSVVHDIGFLDCLEDIKYQNLLTPYYLRLSLKGAFRSKHIIAVSEFTKSRLLIKYPMLNSEQVKVVYNGVDHNIFFRKNRDIARYKLENLNLGYDRSMPLLIYVGEEYPRKCMRCLINSYFEIKKVSSKAFLLKVGASHNPENRAALLNSVSRNYFNNSTQENKHHFAILENVTDHDLSRFYSAADIFISSSKYEGFGLPLLEAMACGSYCIVSDIPAFKEIGKNTISYANPDDPKTFANEYSKLMEKFSTNPNNISAYKRSLDFDWDKTAHNILSFIMKAKRENEY